MKKLFTLILGITLAYSCSSSSDENGNSNTTVVPIAPSNLTGTVVSSTQINLSWTDNSTNETGFKIERKTGTGTYAIVGTTVTDVTTFNDTGLTPSTTYTYRVYSYNAVGSSLAYSNEVIVTTASPTITDIDGNIYSLVTICNQTWMQSNLNVSRYRNGDIIPQVSSFSATSNTGAWCYYQNNTANGPIYGKLYNWYAVTDPRGLAPLGYHVPSKIEFSAMINCHDINSNGGSTIPNAAGGKMKEIATTHWNSPNTGASNLLGFTGLPGGFIGGGNTPSEYGTGMISRNIGKTAWFWSSTPDGNRSYGYSLDYNTSNASEVYSCLRQCGFSVRCIKD